MYRVALAMVANGILGMGYWRRRRHMQDKGLSYHLEISHLYYDILLI